MEWLPLGLRDIILLLVAGAALYLALMLFKLMRVGRRKEPPALREAPYASSPEEFTVLPESYAPAEPVVTHARAVATYEELAAAEAQSMRAPPSLEWDEVQDLFGSNRASPPAPSPAPAPTPTPAPAPVPPPAPHAASQSGFGEHISEHLARTDMEMEVQRMRDEMQRMRQEMEELRAARRVSPQYSEAMELAQRGLTAQEVADQLGISLAEAELVKALSQGRQDYE